MLAQRGPFRRTSGGGISLASYTLSGTQPSVVLDFINGIYSDGTTTPSTIGALLNGVPTVDANGLVMPGDNSITAKGAFATAMSAGAGTVAAVIDKGRQQTAQFPFTMGANNGSPIYLECTTAPQHAINYSGGSAISTNFPACDFTVPNFFAAGFSAVSPKRTGAWNDATPFQDDNNYDAFTPVVLGNLNAGGTANNFTGRYRTIAVYPTRLTAALLPGLRALRPFQTTRRPGVLFPIASGNYATLNNATALKIERTQPWSCVCNFASASPNAPNGNIIFTNVTGSPFCGYEIWIQGSVSGRTAGLVCVRVMQDIVGGSAIDLYGSIQVGEGKAHMVGVTYDGSSLAAGVKIYVDGVADGAVTVAQNNLTGSILGNSGQMWIGNQSPGSNTYSGALINFLAFSSVVRSAGYMTAANSYANKPALDASNTLYFDFTEGSGTTLTDKSANGFNATITGSTWY